MAREFQQQWPELSLRSGAIPFRVTGSGKPEFLLIRRIGQNVWSIPKGQLSAFYTLSDTARAEAFEEAGVRGKISQEPIGSFLHLKHGRGFLRKSRVVEVVLFSIEVEIQADRWPEMGTRERQWFSQEDAPQFVSPGQLRDVLATFKPMPDSRESDDQPEQYQFEALLE